MSAALAAFVSALSTPLGAFVSGMSAADAFGLVVSVLVIFYLLYALLRGDRF
ncbi:MAG TPA: hypothetical protein VLJ42_07940 [Solirubrobacteraceae bacterium]|nr:hypothetical protein [Solirubrobacteraceae bacterium]